MKENRKNKKMMIGVLAVVVLILAVGMVAFALNNSTSKKLQDQLALGQKYLQELDYDNAIAAFEAAIEIDPMCVDAYLGLAEVYVAMEDYDSALKILQKGYDLTGDARLKAEKDRINALLTELANAAEEEEITNKDYSNLTFTTEMYDFEILGTTFSELTFDTVVNHAMNEMNKQNISLYTADGYFFDFVFGESSGRDEDYENIDTMIASGAYATVALQDARAVIVMDSRFNNTIKLGNTLLPMWSHTPLIWLSMPRPEELEEYKEYAVIKDQIIGKTYEEFFNSISEGLFETVKLSFENQEVEKRIELKNGYIYNSTEEIPEKGTGIMWTIVYEENGKKIKIDVRSSSDEEIIQELDITYL